MLFDMNPITIKLETTKGLYGITNNSNTNNNNTSNSNANNSINRNIDGHNNDSKGNQNVNSNKDNIHYMTGNGNKDNKDHINMKDMKDTKHEISKENNTIPSNNTIPNNYISQNHANDQSKRFRAGSISGRLRTASNLEDLGYIDKNQKGILKDLIISGDDELRIALDKYEKGDETELLDLIKKGIFERKNSVDLLENLDFDFLNVVTAKRDRLNSLDDQMSFTFALDESLAHELDYLDQNANHDSNNNNNNITGKHLRSGSISDPTYLSKLFSDDYESERVRSSSLFRTRNASMDSTNSARMFECLNNIVFDSDNIDVNTDIDTNGDITSNDDQHNIATAYPFGIQNKNSTTSTGNRIVKAFTRKTNSDTNTVDMSAYTAVAKSLQNSNSMLSKPLVSSLSSSRTKPMLSNLSSNKDNHNTILNKDNNMNNTAKTYNFIHHHYTLSSLPSSGSGIPTTRKHSDNPENKGVIGAYSIEQRKKRIDKFLEKRNRRVWTKKVKYDVRKNFADSRLRVKGRFVKKEDEYLMRDLLDI